MFTTDGVMYHYGRRDDLLHCVIFLMYCISVPLLLLLRSVFESVPGKYVFVFFF